MRLVRVSAALGQVVEGADAFPGRMVEHLLKKVEALIYDQRAGLVIEQVDSPVRIDGHGVHV
jgi:hypothetical protein